MYKREKVHIREQINNRLPLPQAAAGEGAAPHAAASAGAGSRPSHTVLALKSLLFFWKFD